MVASRSGLEALSKMHPEVQVHLASIDELAAVRRAKLATYSAVWVHLHSV